MKKRMSQLIFLIIATLLISSKAVAIEVPLASLSTEGSYWSPHYLTDRPLCQMEEIKYPLISPLNKNQCREGSWENDHDTFSNKNLNKNTNDVRFYSSIN